MPHHDDHLQPDLFDQHLAQQAAEQAIARVYRGADPLWFIAACETGVQVCRDLPELTTDDIWRAFPPDLVDRQPERRAMGAVMRYLSRRGLIEPIGHTPSAMRVCHARPKTRYRSLAYRGEQASA